MIIRNSLATFKVNLANDSVAKSTPAFEYRLHHWIPEQKKVFIDIGANIGFYSFFAINKRSYSKAFCFEASPTTYNTLKENVRLSKLTKNIKPELTALGSSNKPLYFEQKNIHTGNSQITKKRTGKNIIQVQQTTLDKYIKENNIDVKQIGYIKIDVEGFENEVLKGMKQTLKQLPKRTLIQIEVWTKNKKGKETKNILENNNFKKIKSYRSNCLYIKY